MLQREAAQREQKSEKNAKDCKKWLCLADKAMLVCLWGQQDAKASKSVEVQWTGLPCPVLLLCALIVCIVGISDQKWSQSFESDATSVDPINHRQSSQFCMLIAQFVMGSSKVLTEKPFWQLFLQFLIAFCLFTVGPKPNRWWRKGLRISTKSSPI